MSNKNKSAIIALMLMIVVCFFCTTGCVSPQTQCFILKTSTKLGIVTVLNNKVRDLENSLPDNESITEKEKEAKKRLIEKEKQEITSSSEKKYKIIKESILPMLEDGKPLTQESLKQIEEIMNVNLSIAERQILQSGIEMVIIGLSEEEQDQKEKGVVSDTLKTWFRCIASGAAEAYLSYSSETKKSFDNEKVIFEKTSLSE